VLKHVLTKGTGLPHLPNEPVLSGRKTGSFPSTVYIKLIILQRQARDKHRESTQK
jgi:hypothetical protein